MMPFKDANGHVIELKDVLQELTDSKALLYMKPTEVVYKITDSYQAAFFRLSRNARVLLQFLFSSDTYMEIPEADIIKEMEKWFPAQSFKDGNGLTQESHLGWRWFPAQWVPAQGFVEGRQLVNMEDLLQQIADSLALNTDRTQVICRITDIYKAVFPCLSDNAKRLLLFLFLVDGPYTEADIAYRMSIRSRMPFKDENGQVVELKDVLQELTDSHVLYTAPTKAVYKITDSYSHACFGLSRNARELLWFLFSPDTYMEMSEADITEEIEEQFPAQSFKDENGLSASLGWRWFSAQKFGEGRQLVNMEDVLQELADSQALNTDHAQVIYKITDIYKAVFPRLSYNAKRLLLFLFPYGQHTMSESNIIEEMARQGWSPFKDENGHVIELKDVLQELTDNQALNTDPTEVVYKIKTLTYRTLLFEDFEDEDTFSFKKRRDELVGPWHLLYELFYYNMPEETIRTIIKEKHINIYARSIFGRTILHDAIINKWDIEKIKLLLDNGVDVNAQDDTGHTPLHYAFSHYNDYDDYDKDCSIIELLLSYGAKLVYDFDGNDHLDFLRRHYYDSNERADKLFQLFDGYGFDTKLVNFATVGLIFSAEKEDDKTAENERIDFIPTEVNGHPVVGIVEGTKRAYDRHSNIVIRTDTETIQLPPTLKYIGLGSPCFSGARNIKNLVLPPGLSSIGECAFQFCGVENIKIPDSVVRIEHRAFNACLLLKSIELPPGIRTLSGRVFTDCINLKKVVFHEKIVSIMYEAFFNCISLKTVQIDAIIPPDLGDNVFTILDVDSCLPTNYSRLDVDSCLSTNPRLRIYVPDAAVEDYRHAENWSEYADRILPVSQIPQEQ
jgi:hypothetical protein